MKKYWLKLLAGPLLFGILLLSGNASNPKVGMIAIMLWMLSWWITGVVPIGVTALLPLVLFPLLGILNLENTAVNYANPVIFLFMGGFILGLAIEKWNLHKRIALNIMKMSGSKPSRIILGSMLATALLSMWISNTATTVMMLPIGMSVITLLGDKFTDKNFGLSLMLGIAYAANIGGMTTLIGTPPNLVLTSIASRSALPEISFANWFFFALPLVIILFSVVYFFINRVVFPLRLKKLEGIRELLHTELQKLGRMSSGEKRVLIIMAATAFLWIIRGNLNQIDGLESLSDTMIAMVASVMLFALPSGSAQKAQPLLVWEDTKRLPWGILLLFGGGISIAQGMEETKIVELAGDFISETSLSSVVLIILIITGLSVFLTEVMSNVALVSVFIPISFVIAQNLGLQELQLAIPLTLGASCAFMFPISTPPNAIVFSSGYIPMKKMARIGIILNLISILIITIYSWLTQGWFF